MLTKRKLCDDGHRYIIVYLDYQICGKLNVILHKVIKQFMRLWKRWRDGSMKNIKQTIHDEKKLSKKNGKVNIEYNFIIYLLCYNIILICKLQNVIIYVLYTLFFVTKFKIYKQNCFSLYFNFPFYYQYIIWLSYFWIINITVFPTMKIWVILGYIIVQ